MFLSSPAFHPTPLHKITPFPPFPPSPSLACVQQFPLTGYLVCPQTAVPCALRANPSAGANARPCRGANARPCRPTLDCRSEASNPRAALRRSKSARRRAPRPAAGPPMRAIAGACTVTMATVRTNPPGRQRTFSCQKRRTLRGSDGFAPTTPIRSSTAAAPCSFALSLKPTGGHAE